MAMAFQTNKTTISIPLLTDLSAQDLIYIPGIDEKVLEIFHVLCVGTAMLIIDESYRKAMLSNSI